MVSFFHPDAEALINPNYTPIHLVEQSNLIAEITFEKVGGEKEVSVASVTNILKGKTDQKKFTVDFNATAYKIQAKYLTKYIRELKDETILLFIGTYVDECMSDDGKKLIEKKAKKGFLHFRGQWIVLYVNKNNVWEMDEISQIMLGVFDGSTDMLKKCVQYILSSRDPQVPVKTFAQWSVRRKVDRVRGKGYKAVPVVLKKGTPPLLFIGSIYGNFLYSCNAEDSSFSNATEKHGLRSCSDIFLWIDAHKDGLLDLVSWNGTGLDLFKQKEDGTFGSLKIEAEHLKKIRCIGITAADTGDPESIGLIISTEKSPVLLIYGKKIRSRQLVTGPFPDKSLGSAGKCIVADFDNDNIPDIIQPFEKGGLFYKGIKPGKFAQPSKCAVASGKGGSFAALGDYDHNGVFDIMVTGEHMNRLWHNRGNARFFDSYGYTHSLAYMSKPGGVYCETCDINNDARQDIFIVYPHMSPIHFFNRGFRTFGYSHMMDLAGNELLPQASEGAYTGCMADLNSDGAQDMVLVLRNGEIWIFFRETEEKYALSVNVSLSLKSSYAGPLKVTGWNNSRCAGAWNIYAGGPPAFFGKRASGPLRIKWTFPDGTKGEKEIILKKKPVDLILKK